MKANSVILQYTLFCLVHARPLVLMSDSSESSEEYTMFDDQSIIEKQIPEDIIWDLIGRAMLITEDVITEKKNTFLLKKDDHGFPYLIDRNVLKKYIIQYSIISSDIDIFKVVNDLNNGEMIVVDPITDRLFIANLNKYKEVDVIPIQLIGSRNYTVENIIKQTEKNKKDPVMNLRKTIGLL